MKRKATTEQEESDNHIALNFINNHFIPIQDNQQTLPVINPATSNVLCEVPLSNLDQVDLAVKAANDAFPSWSSRTVKDRIQYLIRYHQLVIKNKEKLAELIVLEHGKTKEEAIAEIAKGNETVEYAISLPQLALGSTLEVSRGVYCQDIKKPLGVVV